jgi:PTS system mannitol-specific IIA component
MGLHLLSTDKVKLNAAYTNKKEAIRAAGQLLVDSGHIDPAYVDKMLEREEISTTYIGNGIAIPHGTKDALSLVKETGLSVIQVPAGVDFGDGHIAYLLIGLAANGDAHLDLLSNIAVICADDDSVSELVKATSEQQIIDIFESGMEE